MSNIVKSDSRFGRAMKGSGIPGIPGEMVGFTGTRFIPPQQARTNGRMIQHEAKRVFRTPSSTEIAIWDTKIYSIITSKLLACMILIKSYQHFFLDLQWNTQPIDFPSDPACFPPFQHELITARAIFIRLESPQAATLKRLEPARDERPRFFRFYRVHISTEFSER